MTSRPTPRSKWTTTSSTSELPSDRTSSTDGGRAANYVAANLLQRLTNRLFFSLSLLHRENMPSHFKFKEYCPLVFRNLRERFGIDDQDFLVRKPSHPAPVCCHKHNHNHTRHFHSTPFFFFSFFLLLSTAALLFSPFFLRR